MGNLPQTTVPAILPGVSKKVVGRIYRAWRGVVAAYTRAHKVTTQFGGKSRGSKSVLDEIEVDEAVMRKQGLGTDKVF